MKNLHMISNTTKELINSALLNLELENPTQEAIKKMEDEERYKWLDSSKTKVLDTITGHKYDPLALIRIQNLYIEILEEKVFGGDNKWKN